MKRFCLHFNWEPKRWLLLTPGLYTAMKCKSSKELSLQFFIGFLLNLKRT